MGLVGLVRVQQRQSVAAGSHMETDLGVRGRDCLRSQRLNKLRSQR
jgi:hypothetical protein